MPLFLRKNQVSQVNAFVSRKQAITAERQTGIKKEQTEGLLQDPGRRQGCDRR